MSIPRGISWPDDLSRREAAWDDLDLDLLEVSETLPPRRKPSGLIRGVLVAILLAGAFWAMFVAMGVD